MAKRILCISLVLCLLFLSSLALGQSRSSSPVDISVVRGELNTYGRRADIEVRFENQTPVTLRIIVLNLTYNTLGGDTVHFSSPEDFQLLVEPGQPRSERVPSSTNVNQGEIIDWPRPRSIDVAVGADVEALVGLAEQVGDDPDAVLALIETLDQIARAMRAARSRHAAAIERLPEPSTWFDWEAVDGLKPNLESSLCAGLGRRILQQRAARVRVEVYQQVASTLLNHNLYPDCLSNEVRLAIARAMVDTDRAQDALILTQRDEQGEVTEQWRSFYLTGRLALASDTANLRTARDFIPGLESINEVKRVDPENRNLVTVADNLLRRAADQVQYLLRNEAESEAAQLLGMMRPQWTDHPQVERASTALAEGLLRYANRSLARDNLIGANNAYVIGVQYLDGFSPWEAIRSQIQEARRNYFVRQAERDIADGNLDAAETALRDASAQAALDAETTLGLNTAILQARWQSLAQLIEEDDLEDAMNLATDLENRAPSLEIFGEDRARTYLAIAERVWTKYGIFAGLANRSRIDLAEKALSLGRNADPERAGALRTKLFLARWLFPIMLLALVVIGGLVMIFKASWRKRLQGRRLWRHGLKDAAAQRLSRGVAALEKAYNLTAFDDRAPGYYGEEGRGHMILQIAALNQQRERDDQVAVWRGEWLALPDLERPFSPDFETALRLFGSPDKSAPAPPRATEDMPPASRPQAPADAPAADDEPAAVSPDPQPVESSDDVEFEGEDTRSSSDD